MLSPDSVPGNTIPKKCIRKFHGIYCPLIHSLVPGGRVCIGKFGHPCSAWNIDVDITNVSLVRYWQNEYKSLHNDQSMLKSSAERKQKRAAHSFLAAGLGSCKGKLGERSGGAAYDSLQPASTCKYPHKFQYPHKYQYPHIQGLPKSSGKRPSALKSWVTNFKALYMHTKIK